MKQAKNNTIILEKCLEDFKKSSDIKKNDYAFEIFSILQITKDRELSMDEIEDSIVDGGNDGGVDSIICIIDDLYLYSSEQLNDINIKESSKVEISLIQCKYEKSFKEAILNTLYTNLYLLFDLDLPERKLLKVFNPKLVDKVLLIRKLILKTMPKGLTPDFNFIYTCKANNIEINDVFTSKQKQIKKSVKKIFKGSNVDFNLYSSEELIEIYQKPKKTDRIIVFKEGPISVFFNTKDTGYLGIVSLKDYYNFITDGNKIIEPIFDSNVRHFQGDVDVNKQIRDTVKNEYDRDFWWLNNGITIIASNYTQAARRLHLNNVQIVNGLQTSFELANNFDHSKDDDRSILVKIIISEDKETIDKIISASNSQTNVTPAILRATDSLQRKIEIFFMKQDYFYERRKNYYRNLGKPTKKIFSVQNTAQAFEAICNYNISIARSTPTKLIKDEKSYKNIFNEEINFQVYLNCCKLYRRVYDYILTLSSEEKNIMKNFAYHLSRILPSFVTSLSKYSLDDISVIDIDNIKDSIIKDSYVFLRSFISKYQENHTDEIITNIAKSKKFDGELNAALNDLFLNSP